MAVSQDFYVYRIFNDAVTVYVGKGTGRRLQTQIRRFGCSGEIIERCKSDDHAFKRERHWIARLSPTDNRSPGGEGGRRRPKPKARLSKADREFYREFERLGSRRMCAKVLLGFLWEGNCEQNGVSKVDLVRMREVLDGPRC